MEFFDKIEEFEEKLSANIQDRLERFINISENFDDFVKNEKQTNSIFNLTKAMSEVITELKDNKFFKNKLLDKKGKHPNNYRKNFPSVELKIKKKKFNQDILFHHNYKRNFFNVYKNNLANYFDQANFRSIQKYYSKISEKKNISKITIDLIKKRINQKIFSIINDRKNSKEKVLYNSSPKLNPNISFIQGNYESKKKSKENSPDFTYEIIKKFQIKNKDKEKKREILIKKVLSPIIFKAEDQKDMILSNRPKILKENEKFVSKTFMDKMHEFKHTFSDNKNNNLNIKEALRKLKVMDKTNNYNDYIDEIFSTGSIIDNYYKNKNNLKIVKRDKLTEIKKKKTDFYQNLIKNERAILETRSNYYVRLERNKLDLSNKNHENRSKTESTTQCDIYKDKDFKRTTVTYLQEHLMRTNNIITDDRKIENTSVKSFLNYVKD